MTVSYISAENLFLKYIRNCVDLLLVADYPNRMLHVILCNKIIYWRFRCFPFFKEFIQPGNVSVSKKYIAGLRACCFYLGNPILFFFRPRKFMFFYLSLLLIGH